MQTTIAKAGAVLLAVLFLQGAATCAVFDDHFTNDDPWINDGIGGDWANAGQTDGATIAESGSNLVVTAAGGWNVVMAYTHNDQFALGSVVTYTLGGLTAPDSGDTTNWDNYTMTGHAIMTIGDWDYDPAVGEGGNAYKAEDACLQVSIRRLTPGQGSDYLVVLGASGGYNFDSSIWVSPLSWDGASDLQIALTIGEDGDSYALEVGDTLSTSGRLSEAGLLTFDQPFWVGVGLQPIGGNAVTASYDRVGVSFPVLEIVKVVANDPDNSDTELSNGDTLTMYFNMATNQPHIASRPQIDGLVDFGGKSLGMDYTGVWLDAATMEITVVDATGGDLPIGHTICILADGDNNVKGASGSGEACTDCGQLIGDWGRGLWSIRTRRQIQPGYPWGDRTLYGVGWEAVEAIEQWDPEKTTIVVVDMVRHYPTVVANEYGKMLARHMNEALHDARARGIRVVFCPANTDQEGYYDGHPARVMMRSLPNHGLSPLKDTGASAWEREHFSLLDAGSWETGDTGLPWDWRQTEILDIMPGDGLTEIGQEVWNYIQEHDVEHVIVAGLVTNYCVLGRPFAIRSLVQAGVDVSVCRDLTFVSAGIRDNLLVDGVGRHLCQDLLTDACVEFIEKYWCPSISKDDLLLNPAAPPARIVDNEFEDGDLFFELEGYEDYRLGGGLYNLSFDNDGNRAAFPSDAVRELDGCVQLQTGANWDVSTVVSRRFFGYKRDDHFDGTEIKWRIRSVSGFLAGPYVGKGLCLGVINAYGDVTGTAPSQRTKAAQVYVSLRDHDGDGQPDGEVCVTDSTGYSQKIPSTEIEFDTWDGNSPMTVAICVREGVWQVQFSEPVNDGQTSLSGSLPSSFDDVDYLHAFAALQDNGARNVKLDRLLVQRCLPGDLNCDLAVNCADLHLLATYWLAVDQANGTDLTDFVTLAGNWLTSNPQ